MFEFKKATKAKAKLKLAIIGPSGSGKTYTALNIAKYLGGKTAVIDTEHGSASKYADVFEFDTLELETFSPETYIEALNAAIKAGYENVIIDSLSHAWMGKDGALELVDRAKKRSQSQNSFTAWADVTPLQNRMIDAIVAASANLIVTMRSKTEYVMETNERGKQTPRKIGLAPIQRDGLEYEFDVFAEMTIENEMIVSKTRCPALNGLVIPKPGKQVADTLKEWLSDGVDKPAAKPAPVQKPVTMAAAGEQLAQGMPLEEAALVKNSEGTPYTEIDTAKLTHMLNAMTKGVRENKYTGDELDTVLYKIEAAKAIIASRP